MMITTRAQWDARPPKTDPVYVAPDRRRYFVVHHSGAAVTQTVRAIQDWCMDGRGFNDIDYNHLVRGSTGEIYEGRGWDVVGAHTLDYNITGVGVCIIGNDECSDVAKASVRWLYDRYNARCGRTLDIRGHRDLATTGTSCPGDRNYAWVRAGLPAPEGWDQMATKAEVKAALAELLASDTVPYVGGPGSRIRANGWHDISRDAKIDYLCELVMTAEGESLFDRLDRIDSAIEGIVVQLAQLAPAPTA